MIDNSSAFRMDDDVPLVVPEDNPEDALDTPRRVIANPNCSTIQMVVALKAIENISHIRRVYVSTYQAASGAGAGAMSELEAQYADIAAGHEPHVERFAYQLAGNLIPHIDVFTDNGYTKEEMKMVNETCKILRDDSIRVTATTVRVPTIGGHSESVNVELAEDFTLAEVRRLLSETPGEVVQDDPQNNVYPMPLNAHEKDEVFVGRLRRDFTQPNTLNMWVVADNLRKGAATNAVQIAEYLVQHGLV